MYGVPYNKSNQRALQYSTYAQMVNLNIRLFIVDLTLIVPINTGISDVACPSLFRLNVVQSRTRKTKHHTKPSNNVRVSACMYELDRINTMYRLRKVLKVKDQFGAKCLKPKRNDQLLIKSKPK